VSAPPGRAGKLYVVGTPIGNLGDITLRALDTLRTVRLIAAEDTRRTGNLLRHYAISARLVSFHEHNGAARLPRLLAALAEGDVALVTDAGTPLVSDPGQELVAAAAAAGFEVVAVPGPSSVVAALSVAGFRAAPFHFLGFLPRRGAERRRVLQQAAGWPGTLVLFEAPHRLRAALADIHDVCGERGVAVCCELTKLHEQVFRGTLAQAAQHFAGVEPRGEFTLVVAGAAEPVPTDPLGPAANVPGDLTSPLRLRRRFEALQVQLGDRRRALAQVAAESGQPRKALYRLLVTRDAAPTKRRRRTDGSQSPLPEGTG
jgi:16S rRNA (cytidine1402-2'-O)-methyltransferase